MTTATARPLVLPRPIEEEVQVSAAHVHEPLTRALIAERDLKSVRQRCRTMLRALNDTVSVSQPIAVFRNLALTGKLLHAARIAESLGEVPVVRFQRDAAGEITGIELALLEREDAGSEPLAFSPVEFGGMAVVE